MSTAAPAASPRRSDAEEFRVIGLIGVGHFYSHFLIFVLPPLISLMKEDYGVSYVQIGLAVTLFNLITGLTQAPVGFLVDRIGPRDLLLAGVALGAIAFAGIGLWPTYTALLIFAALAGLANAVYHPADYSILSANVGERKIGRAFSLHTFAGYAGGAAAPATMALVLGLGGTWQTGLILTGVVGLAIFAVMFVFRSGLTVRPATSPREESGKSGAGIGLLLSTPILMCFAFFVLISLSSGGITQYSVAAFQDLHGLGVEEAQVALTAYLVGSAVGILAGGWIADRTTHHERVAMVGFVATSVITFLIGLWVLPGLAVMLAMGLAGLLFGMIMPSRDMLVRAITPPGQFGKVFGFVTTGFSVGGLLYPLLFGWIMDMGEPRWIFILAPMFMLVATATVYVTRAVQPPRPVLSEAGD